MIDQREKSYRREIQRLEGELERNGNAITGFVYGFAFGIGLSLVVLVASLIAGWL